MSGKSKKKKMIWQQYIAMAFQILVGAACGFLVVWYLDGFISELSVGKTILSYAGLLLGLYAAIVVQLIIHESGHLVFGLLSGYRFCSFRIFSFMWVKEGGQIQMRRLSIAGTSGQCLMSPPDLTDGKLPVVLYNLGGSLMNLIAALLFGGLSFACSGTRFLSAIALLFSAMGCMLAILNGVPMRMGAVDNDGYNAFALTRNPEAMRSFWVQMKINAQIAKGVRLKDMPEEWFAVPCDEAMKNSMVAAMGVFACNRLMDERRFAEADRLMTHMLEIDSGMVGLHRDLLICDRMYVELITENRQEVLDGMLTKEQKKFMQQMKNFPSVLRTEYVAALLHEKKPDKAEKIQTQFEKCAKTYPYPSEVQSERELMQIAELKA